MAPNDIEHHPFVLLESHISLRFSLYHQSFSSYSRFEKRESKDPPKMTLNIMRSKITHIYLTNVLKSQISPHFSPRLGIFEFEKSALTQKFPSKSQGQSTPYMCYWCPQIQQFIPFLSTTNHFRVGVHCKTSAPNDHKIIWNTTRPNVLLDVLLALPISKFQSMLLNSLGF